MTREDRFASFAQTGTDGLPDQIDRLLNWLLRHWLLVVSLLIGLFVGLPWLAPLFMELGWTHAADVVYWLYRTQCHQLPQRSFFLFGAKPMYDLAEIQAAWRNTTDPLLLRQFTGNAQMGWKVAWSDRMVSMYGSLLFWGLAFWPLRRRLKPLPWWGLVLLLLPMAADGFTHLLSDLLGGIGTGFRSDNAWLAILTNHLFPATFYASDVLGSFNSWMRLVTGLLFGLGVVWFAHPRLQAALSNTTYHDAVPLYER